MTASSSMFGAPQRRFEPSFAARHRLDTAIGATEYTIYGDVTCLRVAGQTAAIEGIITNVSPPSAIFAADQSFVVDAFDSGKFGSFPDTVFYTFGTSPPPPDGACPAPTVSPNPISSGDIVIEDAVS